MMVSWIQGFFNGMNVMRASSGKLAVEPPNGQAMNEFIDRYCSGKPKSSILDASIELYVSTERKTGR
ncbi:hypothetical protein [Variovorax soli]|uniref:hypothetical protein n=1 Tax=Variovorax soli TaxID=376815 RepID=UPI0008389096|nr:hypothetical protein [Variovorax soli]